MQCSSCGSAVTPGSVYCNRCGASLAARAWREPEVPKVPMESFIWAIVGLTISGLGAIIGLMAVMKAVLNLDTILIVAFSVLSFLIVIAAEGMLVGLALRSLRDAKEAADRIRLRERDAIEPAVTQPRALPEPASSITEHTTRTFDPVNVPRREAIE